jgi:hypothetical protein
MKNNNYIEANSYEGSSLGIQILGLTVALFMWAISLLGIFSNLSLLNLSLLGACIFLVSLFCYFALKEKKYHSVNLVSSVLICIGFVQISAIANIFYSPPFIWDEVAYTAALPKLYAAKSHFYYASEYGPYSAFPQNYEAISTASLIVFKSLLASKFLNLICALGILVIAGDLSLLIGLPKVFSILGGSVIGLSSAFIIFLPLVKNDLINGFFQSAAILMLLIYSRNGALKSCCLMGVFIGTSIGLKYNSLIFSVCPIALFLWITFISKTSWRNKLKKTILTVLVIIVSCLPWYLNNTLLFLNPVYPIANEFFGSLNQFHAGYSQLFRESFYGDVNFSWANGTVYAFFKRFANEFTPLVVIFGMLGALKGLIFFRNKQELYLGIVTIGTVCLVIRFGFWEPRYSFVLLVLFSIEFAALISFLAGYLLKYKPLVRPIFFIVPICILCLTTLGYIKGERIYGDQSRFFKTHSEKSFLKKYVSGFEIADWLNQNTPKDAVIAVWGHQMFYYLDRVYFHLHPLTESGNLLGVNNADGFYQFLIEKNVSYLCLADWRFEQVPDRTPGLKYFFHNLNEWMKMLESQGRIIQISTIDGSRIYMLNKIK